MIKESLSITAKVIAAIALSIFIVGISDKSAYADNLIENGDFSHNPPWFRWSRQIGYGINLTDNYAIATNSICYPGGQNGNPAAAMYPYGNLVTAIEQSVELPANYSYTFSFLEWGQLYPTTVTVKIYDGNNDLHTLGSFTPAQLIQDSQGHCTGDGPQLKEFDLSEWAGQDVVIRIEATSPRAYGDSSWAYFDNISIEGFRGVTGSVNSRARKGVEGITLHLTGTGGADMTTQTDGFGNYSFNVGAGDYTIEATGEGYYFDKGVKKRENGGVLSAETVGGGFCEGSAVKNKCTVHLGLVGNAQAQFGYTLCAAEDRKPNGDPLTHCPIVLVPGFLGSRVICDTGETWPALPLGVPDWGEMNLLPDGMTNDASYGACNASAEVNLGDEGVIDTVAGSDIYKNAMDFLEKEAPGRWIGSPYDWRLSPVIGATHLKDKVDFILNKTFAKHAVLYGHSMGGLVIREFINDPDNAKKVARIITAGTPYWGAPKSHFALLGGYFDTPAGYVFDTIASKAALQRMTRNLQGIFFLYPSRNLPNWLALSHSTNQPFEFQDSSGEDSWVESLGATSQLLRNARQWHEQNDGFPETDIDYRAVVGAGSPTVLETHVRKTADQEPLAEVVVGNGDSTVPLISATQGAAANGGLTLGKRIPVHYACQASHVALPGTSDVLKNIRGYLLFGEYVSGLLDKCDYAGEILYFPELSLGGGNSDINTHSLKARAASSPTTVSVQSGSETLNLEQAINRGLIQYLPNGLKTAIIMNDAIPVTVNLSGKSVALQVQKVSSSGDGPLISYKPVKGGVKISSGAQISDANGTALKELKLSKKAPTTTSKVVKSKNSAKISLSAKAPNGLLGTYFRIGSTAPQIYKKAFKVNLKKPVKVSFYSVDLYGQAEKWKSVKLKK